MVILPCCLPDDTVSTFTDDILDFILIGHVEGNLSRASRRRVLLTHDDDDLLGDLGLWGTVSSKYPLGVYPR